MAYGTVNADVIGTSVAGSNLGAGNASIMKNRIINGSMVIDQRAAGASVTNGVAFFGYASCDRWGFLATVASKYTAQQNAGSVTPPVGFSNYLGMTSLSAYSLSAGDYFGVGQRIEGFNTSDLAWGTANAKTVTLSFQVYSSLTGTFGGAVQNSAQTRSYPFSYSIPVANTWTSVSVTIAGDTSGTWIGATNGIGISLMFGIGVGSTYSGTANAWAGANYVSATGATSVVGTNGATFYITGVQLEVGSSATGYEYRQYGQELALCQRYYEKSFDTNFAPANGPDASTLAGQGYWAGISNNSGISCQVSYKVTKRAVPTITAYGNNSGYWSAAGVFASTVFAGAGASGFNGFIVQQQYYNGIASTYGHWTASAEL